MKTLFLIGGWALIGLSAVLAIAMHRTDRRLQAFRVTGRPPSSYLLVPLRWKRGLYAGDGQLLVGRAWRLMAMMYVAALAGIALLSQGVDALP
jgi:hypothetical protein